MSNDEKEYYLGDRFHRSDIKTVFTLEQIVEYNENNPSSPIDNYYKFEYIGNESWQTICDNYKYILTRQDNELYLLRFLINSNDNFLKD